MSVSTLARLGIRRYRSDRTVGPGEKEATMKQKLEQMQVVIASEYPQVRSILRQLAENQGPVAVTGEAQNELEAVNMARDVKPHLALIDYRLPHFQGLEGNSLSRIYGLSAARTVAAEVPNATAIVITNADSEIRMAEVLQTGAIPYLRVRKGGASTLVPLRHLIEVEMRSRVVFAELAVHHPEAVAARPQTSIWDKVARISGLLTMSGTVLAGVGFGLLASIIFAGPGVVLIGAGAVGFIVGLGGLRLSKFGARM